MEKYIQKINCFDDFMKLVNPLEPKEKGDLFEKLTKYIFMYHPNYCQFTKNIWLLGELPYELYKKLNIPENDVGIDLVLEDKYGKYHAIQSKFRMNMDKVISWRTLSTFYGLTFGISNEFRSGFYVTNTTEIDAVAKRSTKIIPLYGEFFDDLSDFFTILKSKLVLSINNAPVIIKPRRYQVKMVKAAIKYFIDNDRATIESACGTGKTLTAYWIDRKMKSKLTIVTVPSLYLLSQFFKDWTNQIQNEGKKNEGKKSDFILVGSDADFGEIEYDNNGLIITTDPKEISDKLECIIKTNPYKVIIITTYQSSDKLITALKSLKLKPDLCIFDEAHKTVGQNGNQFNLLLDEKNLKISKRLFISATPKNFKHGSDEEKILSMDDEGWYGNKIYTYNTSDAIRDGYLVDYQIVTMYTDDQYIAKMIDKNKYIWYDNKIIDSNYMATAIMLLNEFKKGDCTHLVTYHNTIVKSKVFGELLEKLNETYGLDIHILNVDGSHSMKQRNKIFKEFTNSELSIMVTSRILNEGVNIPIIDSVCFVDPRKSTVDIIQCFGRALRLHSDKKMAKIYVPIIVDDIIDIDENTIFGNLIRILKCLNETDSTITEYFSVTQNGGKHNRQLIRNENYMSIVKIGNNINVNEWMNNIYVSLWKKIDGWEYKYNLLVEFIKIYQRLPSDKSMDLEEKMLGNFCRHYKKKWKKGKISKYHYDNFDRLEGWLWEREFPPNKKFDELKAWINENHRVPTNHNDEPNEKILGNFCSNIRVKYKEGRLSKEDVINFETLPYWFWMGDHFEENYQALKRWIDTFGKMPSRYSETKNEEEIKLNHFCGSMRQKRRKGKLNSDQIRMLESLELWFWCDEDRIRKKYESLKEWFIANKKVPNHRSKNEFERKIGQFYFGIKYKNRYKYMYEQVIALDKFIE